MLENFIAVKIKEYLPFEPTNQQTELIDMLGSFIVSTNPEKMFLLKGYAGTGKTSVISALVKMMSALKQKTQLLAPTGRAAKVMSNISGNQAFTIHKKIYRQKSMTEFRFQLSDNLFTHTLFVVDEASMISNSGMEATFGSGRLLDDLISYVYSGEGCSLLLIGDIAQLPPVMLEYSPALQKEQLAGYGLTVEEFTLTHVVRQALESGILYNATMLRSCLTDERTSQFPKFQLNSFSDVVRLDGQELIDEINNCYQKVGVEDTIVITRSNKRANIYNNGIRSRVMMKEDELTNGDLLMVTRNNYFWNKAYKEIDFIANGDVLEVVRVKKYYSMYGFRFVDLTLSSLDDEWEIDARVWLDSLYSDSPGQTNKITSKLFQLVEEDYAEIRNKKERFKKVMESEYFNALQVKFAYAITCHKAQGGQWKRVFVDQGQITNQHLGIEYYRWLYTAFTRAQEKVYLVNFPESCFES